MHTSADGSLPPRNPRVRGDEESPTGAPPPCFDRHEHSTRIRAVMSAYCAQHVLSLVAAPCLLLPPCFISPRRGNVWYPEIAIVIKQIHFTQPCGIVGRAGYDG